MRLLLDTNVFLWAQNQPDRIGDGMRLLRDARNELNISVVTPWEIAIKYAAGKLDLPDLPRRWVPSRLRAIAADVIAVEAVHALAVAELPMIHRDPFDRLLVAQAQLLGLTIVTGDQQLTQYDVPTVLVG